MTISPMKKVADVSSKMSEKIKQTWTKLTDADIKLYSDNRTKFFLVLKEKQNIMQAEAEKMLKEFDKSCCGSNKAA